MKSFKKFIIEAKVSDAGFDKSVEITKRYLEKKIKSTFFRYGGPKGYVELISGKGILYIYKRNKAIRFNYIGGAIKSVTLWKVFSLSKPGDITIDLDGLSLVSAAKYVLDVIENPSKTGKVRAFESVEDEDLKVLTEAKRIKPDEFYSMVLEKLPAGVPTNNVPVEHVKNVAAEAGVSIPSVFYTNLKVKGTRGKGGTGGFDLSRSLTAKEANSKATEPDYYIKITAQDRDTKKFLSVKGDKRAKEIMTTVRNSVNNPDVKKEIKNPDSLFGIMKNLVQLVSRGSRNSLIIYGGPGTGKTYTVTETLKQEGLSKGRDWFVVKGKVTTVSLYQMLFMHRERGILVFDDTDSVWGDQEAANVLKAALDSYDERTISWLSARTMNVSLMSEEEREKYNEKIDEELKLSSDGGRAPKLPSEFLYNGRIIFISNLEKSKFDSAVLTRSAKIDMTLTDEQTFMRMRSVLEFLGDKNVGIDVKNEIVDYLQKQNSSGALTDPSMRTFVAAEDLYKSGLPNWKELLDFV